MENENKGCIEKNNYLAVIKERSMKMIDDVKWNKMDGNAITDLHLAFTYEVFSSVAEKKIAKEI